MRPTNCQQLKLILNSRFSHQFMQAASTAHMTRLCYEMTFYLQLHTDPNTIFILHHSILIYRPFLLQIVKDFELQRRVGKDTQTSV